MTYFNNFISKINKISKRYFIVFSVTFFIGLISLFVWRNFQSRPHLTAVLINKDISRILDALSKIDRDCSILDVEGNKNAIDFLSVEKFSGSEVGPFNLAYPKNWKGPYIKQNPALQGISYEIVTAKDGIFVVPGNGVYLPTGLTIGKDFKIDKDSLILQMIKKGGELNFDGRPLAVKIDFVIGDWDTNFKTKKEKLIYWKKMIDEFNAAIPFTMRKIKSMIC